MIKLKPLPTFQVSYFLEKTQTEISYKSNNILDFLVMDYCISHIVCPNFGNSTIVDNIIQSSLFDDEDLIYYQTFKNFDVMDVTYTFFSQRADIHPSNMLEVIIEYLHYYVPEIEHWPRIMDSFDIMTLDLEHFKEIIAKPELMSLLEFSTLQNLLEKTPVVEETHLHV